MKLPADSVMVAIKGVEACERLRPLWLVRYFHTGHHCWATNVVAAPSGEEAIRLEQEFWRALDGSTHQHFEAEPLTQPTNLAWAPPALVSEAIT